MTDDKILLFFFIHYTSPLQLGYFIALHYLPVATFTNLTLSCLYFFEQAQVEVTGRDFNDALFIITE